MVSKYDHCFHELFLGQRPEELPCEIACILSTYADLEEQTKQYGVPFRHIPVTPTRKHSEEEKQLSILKDKDVDLLVLARYIQILSPEFLESF